ncbi:beta-1,3-galactosyltransferase brn-like [Mizuhopecten yessoensis]|uniref:Hexosyltransferase n=1 Tax=Mizuhopecten yessoensis TaxID=6573 RepID=A0A210R0B5_MIZYE|nr:beta-1,3-galactosyltransferase brn-like [Mizuhopecten yessoensis]XP_021345092.1 beta-1,3-galactosyltransferase brn-like [Mizuhopecten yessoensis]XP_021345099.1 beta-1,3-galactosyltransferase brn-like [Mizuhopecten yessoensis]XP_021345109.1 beta-1,3-galactosyltransferase brn-like [Mizuhopecten yessoensis]XP_021345120.1 beta-1,3-galactosyltransferase brn-like [Mizuhopecten yessoensis]XP_021345128.1 beta-1,3-galactosyltransferase brn-like [Mizuhopecten yessoensis]OWF54463.1 Beta-1,3-galactosy
MRRSFLKKNLLFWGQGRGIRRKNSNRNPVYFEIRMNAIRKRQRLSVLIVLVCCLILINIVFLYKDNNVIPYSEFTYPVKMNFSENYKVFKTEGRQPAFNIINPHPFKYIHLRKKCKFKENGTPSLLILVKSTVNNFHLRDAARTTWGNSTGENIEIAFLLAHREAEQPEVDKEAALYGDIVQESFLDSYMNNTYKTIMGFNWAVQFCGQASHIVFVDDDHYLNIQNLLTFIETLNALNKGDLMIGNLLKHSIPYRSRFSRWSVSLQQYPFDRYPPYLAGAVYLVSRDTANKMVFAFPYVKYLGIDDAYLGIVARKVGIELQHEETFIIPPFLLYTDPSQVVYGEFKDVTDFEIVNRVLHRFAEVKMCIFTWKCQFSFLL